MASIVLLLLQDVLGVGRPRSYTNICKAVEFLESLEWKRSLYHSVYVRVP